MRTWTDVKDTMDLTDEEKTLIKIEEELIDAMVKIRISKGLSQEALAKNCNMKQSTIARMEKSVHSPQVDSMLKVLYPLGYTLQIVPINNK